MTDKFKSAIAVLKGLYHCRHELSANECVGRHCNQCECFSEKSKEDKSLKLAINSLSAWEEVLNQLQEWKNNAQNEHEQKISYAYFSAIKIINQHLSEIDE